MLCLPGWLIVFVACGPSTDSVIVGALDYKSAIEVATESQKNSVPYCGPIEIRSVTKLETEVCGPVVKP